MACVAGEASIGVGSQLRLGSGEWGVGCARTSGRGRRADRVVDLTAFSAPGRDRAAAVRVERDGCAAVRAGRGELFGFAEDRARGVGVDAARGEDRLSCRFRAARVVWPATRGALGFGPQRERFAVRTGGERRQDSVVAYGRDRGDGPEAVE